MKIAIVTDSTSDIPGDLAEAHHIHIIPNILVIDGQSVEDGVGISRQDFYEQLPGMRIPPTTATASSGVYQQLYEKLFQQGASNILSIHTSGLLSGIINAASTAAQSFGERVSVIDSGSVSLGLGFQVLAAAESAAIGDSLNNILDLLKNVRQRLRVCAMLDTLEYVHRSGRVSWARARLGNLLRIKPFIQVKEGQVLSLGEARTRNKGVIRLLEMLTNLGPLERLAILHTNAEDDARQLLADFHPELPFSPLIINITTIIGSHIGPNCLGFAAVIR
jgi:DegV family protein with EDD domain